MSASTPPDPPAGSSPDHRSLPLETLIAQRRETVKRLTGEGINPYPYAFERSHSLAAILKEFEGPLPEHGSDKPVRTAGRLITVRDMGKSCFAHIADGP